MFEKAPYFQIELYDYYDYRPLFDLYHLKVRV